MEICTDTSNILHTLLTLSLRAKKSTSTPQNNKRQLAFTHFKYDPAQRWEWESNPLSMNRIEPYTEARQVT